MKGLSENELFDEGQLDEGLVDAGLQKPVNLPNPQTLTLETFLTIAVVTASNSRPNKVFISITEAKSLASVHYMQLPLIHLGCGAPPLIATVDLLISSEVSHIDGQYVEQHA